MLQLPEFSFQTVQQLGFPGPFHILQIASL